MARARSLKPSFFTNEQLAECTHFARLLFTGLWCLADRDGKLRDRPRRIKAELFPYEDCQDVEEQLVELAALGQILRYEVGGERYILIPGFKKHQNPHPREPKSEIPDPSEEPCNATAGRGEVLPGPAGSSLSPFQDLPSPLSAGSGEASSPPAPVGMAPSSVVAVLPCVGHGAHDYAVTQAEVDAWAPAYPGIDVRAEVLKARNWLEVNPTKRKTQSGVPRFLVSWFGRAQDSVRGGGGAGKPLAFAPAMQHTHEGEVAL